jgi:hypothetical protein
MSDRGIQKEPRMENPWFSAYMLRGLFSLSCGLLICCKLNFLDLGFQLHTVVKHLPNIKETPDMTDKAARKEAWYKLIRRPDNSQILKINFVFLMLCVMYGHLHLVPRKKKASGLIQLRWVTLTKSCLLPIKLYYNLIVLLNFLLL